MDRATFYRRTPASRDAELSFLLDPAIRERAGERRDGQIGRSVAVRDRLNNARRHEGQGRQISNVTLDLILALRDLVEGLDPAFNEIAHPRARLGDRGQQRLDRLSIEIGLGRWPPCDSLAGAGARWRP